MSRASTVELWKGIGPLPEVPSLGRGTGKAVVWM
jgi:hypothetical protein